jgi:hypothetical protein
MNIPVHSERLIAMQRVFIRGKIKNLISCEVIILLITRLALSPEYYTVDIIPDETQQDSHIRFNPYYCRLMHF